MLLDEVVDLFSSVADGVVVDGTVGGGGHAAAILAACPSVSLVGLDLDAAALEHAARRLAPFADRSRLVHANYVDAPDHLLPSEAGRVCGVLLDLGISSLQLDDPARGFGFRCDGPLDMRLDPSRGTPAGEIVNRATREELAGILTEFGEERFASRIAAAIVRERERSPIATTAALAEIVRAAVPRRFHRPGIHPATKSFQALRIAVNGELASLDAGLPALWGLLRPRGILAVISFHSLEDRRVKTFLRGREHPCTCPPDLPDCVCGKTPQAERLVRRAVRPSAVEIERNPRARSARLRAARRLP
ncbi:MAG: 16S rRNA (cytosine(1402)-N(4))-methyltransferase RsmH [Candidatus Bipolaricaulota bacterium]|nr:MAG: 16S rRNA (cytosine(1402)-N(4))-methyltransferase RsmH [Candidatus Bipolaricaulota bacterium]